MTSAMQTKKGRFATMQCECINTIENKVYDNFAKTLKPNETITEVSMDGQVFLLEGGESLSIPVRVQCINTMKTGKARKTKKIFDVLFHYCPFCGKKIEGEQPV